MRPARRARGRTARGRSRAIATRVWEKGRLAPPLLRGCDHGNAIAVHRDDVAREASQGDGWIEPFLAANADALARLTLTPELRAWPAGAQLSLRPGPRIGAMPLRSPVTRKIVAGLLVEPRFRWESMGQVLGGVAFRVEPDVGGAPLVPGSAREVPPWILAGPVLARLAELLRHLSRRFEMATETRTRPRGHVDWNAYAREAVPRGDWQRFRCTFPDLRDDSRLFAAMRWTVSRLRRELEFVPDAPIARLLLEEAASLLLHLGPGPEARPTRGAGELERAIRSEWLSCGLEAMAWVAEERGLGGERSLDGLAWSLAVDKLWEAWVERILEDVASRLGARLQSARRGDTTRPLAWSSRLRSLGHLAPDAMLLMPEHHVLVDAKYKPHLAEIARSGWEGVPDAIRESHRADLHQALAYASLSDLARVDTVLAYPVASSDGEPPVATAELPTGRRRVRVHLVGVPFGFGGTDARQRTLDAFESFLCLAQ